MSMATASQNTAPDSSTVAPRPPADAHDYRAVCSAAVVSIVIAVLGLSAFWLSGLLLIPIVGLLLGVYAWLTIRGRQNELTGMALAIAAIYLSIVTIVGGSGWHAYVYAHEFPDDVERISYRQLRVDPSRVKDPIPQSAKDIDGNRVGIKGYMLDTKKGSGIRDFFLVRDKGDCCFGGKPAIDQRVLVLLDDGQMAKYSDRYSKVIGEFQVAPDGFVKEGVQGDVLYIIRGKLIE